MRDIQLFLCISGIVLWASLIFGAVVAILGRLGGEPEPMDTRIYEEEKGRQIEFNDSPEDLPVIEADLPAGLTSEITCVDLLDADDPDRFHESHL